MLRTVFALLLVPALICGWIPHLSAGEPKNPPPQGQPNEGWLQKLGDRFEHHPFYIETDVGATRAEREAYVNKFKAPLIDSANYFLKTYGLNAGCFDEFAKYYYLKPDAKNPLGRQFEALNRVRLWKRYDDFLKDFQKRYDTKTIPGAFFGTIERRDEYGNKTGILLREINTYVEGQSHEEILRSLYHEMGHLFMRTFITYSVEVPSWIEEGNAQLLQYRKDNGTKPEAERDEREGHLVEMVHENSTIPWADFTQVKNAHNLDFTHLDPLRSTIQYTQTWSAMEFVIGTPARQQAYIQFLGELKAEAKKWLGTIKSEQEFRDGQDKILYQKQGAAFKKFFGADMIQIEDTWKKEWVLKRYETQVKTNPVLRYYRGDWHLLRARFAKDAETNKKYLTRAEELFQECIKESPKLAEGYVGMGRVCLERGQIDQAGDWFDQGLGLGALGFEANFYGGIARVRANRPADAIAPLRKALAKRPGHAQANLYLGRAIGASATAGTATALLDEALSALRKARDSEQSETANTSFCEGAILLRAGRNSQAYIAFLRARDSNPQMALMMALAKAHDLANDDALALLEPLKNTVNGAYLIAVINSGNELPQVTWSDQCWPIIAWKGARAAPSNGKESAQPSDSGASAPAKDNDTLFK